MFHDTHFTLCYNKYMPWTLINTHVTHYANANFICFNDSTTVCIRHFVFPLNSPKRGRAPCLRTLFSNFEQLSIIFWCQQKIMQATVICSDSLQWSEYQVYPRSLLEKIATRSLEGGSIGPPPLLLSTQFIRLTWNLVHIASFICTFN